ncbi:9487_t:CDS:1, partial [Dentiscutata heterogama]
MDSVSGYAYPIIVVGLGYKNFPNKRLRVEINKDSSLLHIGDKLNIALYSSPKIVIAL